MLRQVHNLANHPCPISPFLHMVRNHLLCTPPPRFPRPQVQMRDLSGYVETRHALLTLKGR